MHPFAYVKQKGTLGSTNLADNSTVIPGMGLKYEFNESTTLALDYKFYKLNDNLVTTGQNDWKANRVITRLNVKF
jgi:hypothetical protein